MKRPTLGSLSRVRRTFAGLALLIAATIGSTQAQPASSACQLVAVAELEAAIGGKASNAPSGSKHAIPGVMTLDDVRWCCPGQVRLIQSAFASSVIWAWMALRRSRFEIPAKRGKSSGRPQERGWSKRPWELRFVFYPDGPTWPQIRPAAFPVERATSRWT